MDADAVTNAMLACSKANRWEEALHLLRLYGSNNTSMLAFNSLIGSCGRGGRPDMALEILNEMEEYGVRPNERSYRNAIIACNQAEHERRRAGHFEDAETDFEWWEAAVSLLRRMKESKLRPDIQTYSSVISACEAAGEWQRALKILQSIMEESNTTSSLNVYCLNAAISACEKGGK
jgi:pentatricopeptide repeat domain-containing protein 1